MTDRASIDDWQLLSHLSQVFRNVSDSFTDQVDIPRGQATLLCVLAIRDGMTQSEIAEQLSVQGATVTNMLQRLEETGLVIRRRDPEDNRLVRVYLTEAGREKERSINAQLDGLQALIFKGLREDERALLRKWLNQIIANISAKA